MRIMGNFAKKLKIRPVIALLCALCIFLPLLLSAGCFVYVPVERIEFIATAPRVHINPEDGTPELRLRVNDGIRIDSAYVRVIPEFATHRNFRLESSNSGILEVFPTGAVQAVAVGRTTLTATASQYPKISTQITVVVDYAIPARAEIIAPFGLIHYTDPEVNSITF